MTKILKYTLAISCFIFLTMNFAYALDLTLAWDSNPEPDIAGYKLYYQSDTATLPLEGFEAFEGNSPINVGKNNSQTLSGLPDGRVYYVAVSAYNSAGVESALSSIVASEWVPELIAPTNDIIAEPTVERFIWGSAPQGYDVTYTLYYGTDPALQVAAAPPALKLPDIHIKPPNFFALLFLLGLLYALAKSKKKTLITGTMALIMGFSLAACGGGGSTSPDGSLTGGPPSADAPLIASAMTTVLAMGTTDYYEVYDLDPATTYYWKVVAQDVSNPSLRYESPTNSFTTATN